jgi:hypothetical protein
MNARGLLSEESGIENEKPAGIADTNFRKVALLFSAAQLALALFGSAEGQEEENREQSLIQRIWPFKKAFDGLYVMPVTCAIRDCFLECERPGKPARSRSGAMEFHDYVHIVDFDKLFDPAIWASSTTLARND